MEDVKKSWEGVHVRDTAPEPASETIAFWLWLAAIGLVIFGLGVGTGWLLWG